MKQCIFWAGWGGVSDPPQIFSGNLGRWGAGVAISRGSIPGPKFPDFPPNKLHGKCCLSKIRFKDQFESWAGTRIWIQRIPIFPITAFSGGGKIPCFLARGLGQKKKKNRHPNNPLCILCAEIDQKRELVHFGKLTPPLAGRIPEMQMQVFSV